MLQHAPQPIATKRKEPPPKFEDADTPPIATDDPVKKPRLVPLDEVCLHMFEETTRRSIELIKQHYQRRFADDGSAAKLQRALADREMDQARIRRLEADKTRVEAHLSVLASRALKADKDLRDAEAVVENQQKVIDRLNNSLMNLTAERRPARTWEQQQHWEWRGDH